MVQWIIWMDTTDNVAIVNRDRILFYERGILALTEKHWRYTWSLHNFITLFKYFKIYIKVVT